MIGRLCVKLAGRDAGRECLIVEDLKDNFVLIDGNTRRRKCNLKHLKMLPQKAELKKGAVHADVAKALTDMGFEVVERVAKAKKEVKKVEEKTEDKPKKGLFSKLKKEESAEKPKKEKSKPKKKVAKKAKAKK